MKLQRNYSGNEGEIRLNDRDSFNTAFRSYYEPLCYYASKFVPKGDAEDVVENLFLTLWNKQQVFASAVHMQAFLYLATRNGCLNMIKSSRKDRTTEISDELVIAEDDHLRYMIEAETVAEIYRAVDELPSQCSKVIRMGYLEGFNNAEIAEQLGLSEQTVKNYKGRGLDLLKKKLPGNTFMLFMLLFQHS